MIPNHSAVQYETLIMAVNMLIISPTAAAEICGGCYTLPICKVT
jgi:hypothetical protein